MTIKQHLQQNLNYIYSPTQFIFFLEQTKREGLNRRQYGMSKILSYLGLR